MGSGHNATDITPPASFGETRLRSPGADRCYAETLSKRYGWVTWGPGEVRKPTSAANWRRPMKWHHAARAAGVRCSVFCASLADVFDAEVTLWRDALMDLIEATTSLDWLLLSKRPQVALKYFERRKVPDNVWMGTTVEGQKIAGQGKETADRAMA